MAKFFPGKKRLLLPAARMYYCDMVFGVLFVWDVVISMGMCIYRRGFAWAVGRAFGRANEE